MPQNDEAERLLNMLHESKAGRDVRNAVSAFLRTQAARIAELEAADRVHASANAGMKRRLEARAEAAPEARASGQT